LDKSASTGWFHLYICRPMGQKKLYRFGQIKTFGNVLEYPTDIKGKWAAFFGNGNPVVLELACGRGEYTVGLAKLHPEKNFIGVDIKGNRIYIGAKKCLAEGIKNAAFLRTQIGMLADYFTENEVSEIWLTFPDPQLRVSKAKKRLTHPKFLRLYKQVLRPDGFVHLKTDSPNLFHFTQKVIELYRLPLVESNDNVYVGNPPEDLKIKTYYESLDIAGSNKVHYLKFKLAENMPDIDLQLQEQLKQEEETNPHKT
jgi:tRNA (guanine-N7-)-methyltransferase